MTAAQNYRDMRATVDMRMALAPEYDPGVTCDRSDHTHASLEDARECAGRPLPTGPGDVWCAYCPERATVEVYLTSGETRAYCSHHITRLTIQTPLNRIEKTWENCNA